MTAAWLRSRRLWGTIAGIGAVMAVASRLPLTDWSDQLNQTIEALGIWAAPAFIGVYGVATVLGIPNLLFLLAAGSLFGLFKGFLIASLADILGAIACFWLGRTLFRDRIKRWLQKNPKFQAIDRAVERNGWKILLLTRLSPVVPSNLLNYGFSCTRVTFRQYALCTWVGMIPVVAFYTYLGTVGSNLLRGDINAETLTLQLIGLALAIAAAGYTTYVVRRSLHDQENTDRPAAED
jgi:uncharacterized membrane protein YdjX (TVP38/TMEM64 family)